VGSDGLAPSLVLLTNELSSLVVGVFGLRLRLVL
jgi:hypothetical protein